MRRYVNFVREYFVEENFVYIVVLVIINILLIIYYYFGCVILDLNFFLVIGGLCFKWVNGFFFIWFIYSINVEWGY